MNLLNLPKYVFLPILSEWLEIIDIGLFDSALCNYELRPIFLMHINSRTICLKGTNNRCVAPVLTKCFVYWINSRDVGLDYIDVSSDLRKFDIVPFVLKNAQLIRRISSRRIYCELSIKLLEFVNNSCFGISSFCMFQSIKVSLDTIVPTTLTDFDLNYCCHVNIDNVIRLIRICPLLISVSLAHCRFVDENPFESSGAVATSPALESLKLVHCSSKIERYKIAARLIEGCSKLSRIVVSGGRNDEECLHPSGSCRWRRLTHIDWSDSYLLMNSSLRYLVADCPLLTSLCLKNCCRIRDTSLLVIAASCPKLQNLIVGLSSRYKHEHPFCHISDLGLTAVLNSCKEMSQWGIYDCSVTLEIVRLIITQGSDRLKSLLLFSEFISVNDECIVDLIQYCSTSLTALALNNLDNVSNESLSQLTSSCSQLVDFALLNHRAMSSLSTPIVSLVDNCTRLVRLQIVEDLVNHNANVSRSCYYMIATQCKLLEELSIANSHEINDLSIIQFTSYCPYVTSLHLSNCWNVVGDCLQEVTKVYGRRLATLLLINNNKAQGFSDAMLMNTLPVWSHHITLLDLSHNVKVSSKCITRVLRRCGDRLTSLNLSYCTELTSFVSTSIALYCSSLSYLYLDYCPSISDESIFHILQKCLLLLRLSMKGRAATAVATPAGGADNAMSLFWLSDLHSLYPDVVVT